MEKKGKNLKYLRENNTREVLKYLALNGDCSRIKLSKELGLSKMTITNIVNDLLKSDYICESELVSRENMGCTGPKPIMLSVKHNKIIAIGVYVSRERLICSLSDVASGEFYVDQYKLELSNVKKTFVNDLCRLVQKALDYLGDKRNSVIGIGLATVGLVNNCTGTLVRSTDFLGDAPIPIKDILEERFHIPVFASNDAQAAIIGEQLYGYGRKYNNYLYLGLGHGIGSAVISDGELIIGRRGFALEAGHMSIDYNGKKCDCGNRGCLEVYASLPVLLSKSRTSSVDELMEHYESGDERAISVMNEFVHAVSVGLTNLSNLFDVELIIFGHEGSLFTRSILDPIQKNVNTYSFANKGKEVQIVTSTFGTLAGLRGASSIVFAKFFSGEISWNSFMRNGNEEMEEV
ncbi:ROK family transcriptional regulator [[Clostridium] polysaccharolyticum]|uniref:Sugar kinase of the NBD/HSP70 family, may contain an N-terminal HTH domain n=1 Tax=[Clostridium] polysaccharolyticum TaxID=29364 RepID=A0A1I0DTV7_9FIRM|nr:ROK family transcriptional regulator [[Clostridium] polysaccharolyticum]SET35903.1 Sugar kinase of the NBD/HSP70 family, may contain an N-terminal HTH domain [[Clostridium] polysaccharolyticum]